MLLKGFNEIEGPQNVQPADYCSIFISFNVAIVQCLFIIIAMLSAFLQQSNQDNIYTNMSRRIRHIHARNDEWVVVHRDKKSDNSGVSLAVIIILYILLC